jgi:aquaporin Z
MLHALLAETVGTFIFFMCILQAAEPIPIAIGLLAAIYIFGKVSGGHFNSTVSLLMLMKGDIDFNKFIAYVLAQCIGAVLALSAWKFLNDA